MMIYKYIFTYNFAKSEKDESGYEGYSLYNPEICLFVEDGLIVSIASYEKCFFMGRNIIGMSVNEFISYTGERYYGEVDVADFEDDNIPQYIYEFENIGLQIWAKGKEGKIVTTIASIPYYP